MIASNEAIASSRVRSQAELCLLGRIKRFPKGLIDLWLIRTWIPFHSETSCFSITFGLQKAIEVLVDVHLTHFFFEWGGEGISPAIKAPVCTKMSWMDSRFWWRACGWRVIFCVQCFWINSGWINGWSVSSFSRIAATISGSEIHFESKSDCKRRSRLTRSFQPHL